MLIITRKRDQSIKLIVPGLDEPILVMLTQIRGGEAKLGVTAPSVVEIRRQPS